MLVGVAENRTLNSSPLSVVGHFPLIPRTYLCVHPQMAQLGLFATIFPTTLYRGARIRTQVTSVSRVAPDWDI